MFDELVVEELEANLVAGLDRVGRSRSWLGTLVATKIVGVHQLARVGGVVAVAVLPSVGISVQKSVHTRYSCTWLLTLRRSTVHSQ